MFDLLYGISFVYFLLAYLALTLPMALRFVEELPTTDHFPPDLRMIFHGFTPAFLLTLYGILFLEI